MLQLPPAESTLGVSLATNGLRQCAGMYVVHICLASRCLRFGDKPRLSMWEGMMAAPDPEGDRMLKAAPAIVNI
jgi:hypothetical protein